MEISYKNVETKDEMGTIGNNFAAFCHVVSLGSAHMIPDRVSISGGLHVHMYLHDGSRAAVYGSLK